MSTSIGRLVINTRERAVSNDIVRLQDLFGQDVAEILRGVSGVPDYPAAVAPEDRDCVLRGLTCSPGAGMTIDVVEGHGLVYQSAGAIGADDSRYRLLHNRATSNQVVAASDPVNDRWDLVEATFADDITESQLRDIYDPATGTFAPVLVTKVRRAGATFQVTTGVAGANPFLPAFSGSPWIPIAAVRVQAAVAAVTQSDILDMRPLWVPAPFQRRHGIVDGLTLAASDLTADAATFQISAGEAIVRGQLVRRTSVETVTLADRLDPTVVAAAGEWLYVYLFACKDGTGCRPRITTPAAATREGFVVVTDVAPGIGGAPSAAVTFPNATGTNHTIFAGSTSTRAVYLGAIKLGAVATDVAPFRRNGDWITWSDFEVGVTNSGVYPNIQPVDLGVSNRAPATAMAAKVQPICDFGAAGGAVGADEQRLQFLVGAAGGITFHTIDFTAPDTGAMPRYIVGGPYEVPLSSAQVFRVAFNFTAGAARWGVGVAAQRMRIMSVLDPTPRVQ